MPFVVWVLGYQLAGLAFAAVDVASIWQADSGDLRLIARHLCVILLAAGSALGLLLALLDRIARTRATPARVWVPIVSALPFYLVGQELFSGAWIARQSYAPIGPLVFVVVADVMLGLGLFLSNRFQSLAPRLVTLGWAVLGGALLAIDRLALSGLYPTLHDALTLAAWLCLGYAAASLLDRALQRAHALPRRMMFATGVAMFFATSLPIAVARSPNVGHRQLLARHGGTTAQIYGHTREAYRWYQMKGPSTSAYAAPVEAWLDEANVASRYREESTRARWHRELGRRSPLTRAHGTADGAANNIILVTVDTLRADVEAATRAQNGLDAFARDALRFSRAYAPSASTRVSLPVLTTGRVDARNGEGNIIQKLRARGYETALVMSKVINTWLEFQDQDWLDDAEHVATPSADAGWQAAAVSAAAKSFVEARSPKRPLFLWVHFSDVHDWSLVKDLSAEQSASSTTAYRAVWAREGAQVASLLNELRRMLPMDRTTIIFASDHGELLGERGRSAHGRWLDAELVRVPLWVLTPGRAGAEIDETVGLLDVAPTIAAVTGLSFDGFEGVSLLEPIPADRVLVMAEQYEIGAVRGALRLVFAPSQGTLRLLDESKPHESREFPLPPKGAVRDLLEPLLGSPYARTATTPLDP